MGIKTKLFFIFTLVFITGTIFAPKIHFDFFALSFVFLILLSVCTFLFMRKRVFQNRSLIKFGLLFCFACLVFFLGLFRFYISENNLAGTKLLEFSEESVEFLGVVKEEPSRKKDNVLLVVEAQFLKEEEKIIKIDDERINVYVPFFSKVSYGDLLVIKGKLQKIKNKEDSTFDYESFSKKDRILFQIFNAEIEVQKNVGNPLIKKLKSVKNFFEEKMSFYLSEPHSSLVSGMIIAGKNSLPKDIQDQFVRTGIIHIVVLSGFNIAVIIGFLQNILGLFKVNRKISFVFITTVLLLFVLMAGGTPPVIRAVLMASIVLLAKVSYQNLSPNKVLLFVAFLICLWNPYSAPFDTSFQLSFLATFAIINLSPIIETYLVKIRAKILRETISQTLSAIIMVSPLILYLLGNFSIVALPVNIFILPLIPIVMLFGFFIPVFSFVPPVSSFFAFLVFVLTSFIFKVVTIASSLPFASVSIKNIPFIFVLIIYVFIFIFLYKKKKRVEKISTLPIDTSVPY